MRAVRRWFVGLSLRPHLPRRTVRLRLTLLYSCLFLALGAALLAFTYVLVEQSTQNSVTVKAPNGIFGAIVGAPVRRDVGTHQQPVVAVGHNAAIQAVPRTLPTPKQARLQARRIQALVDQQRADQLNQLLTQSGVALAIMTVVSVAIGWLVAGRVLRPLRTITTAARSISANNLHERLALRGPEDELKELGDTFDDLLGRLERSFEAQRAFVANASHELRTPLARQRTVAQVALADPDATIASLRAAHERVLASGRQQERLIEALLTLTRGQAGPARRGPVDLARVARGVLEARHGEARERRIELDAALEPAVTMGDLPLVERLVANLADNALHHNHPTGHVRIATSVCGEQPSIRVSNDGPNVPPSEVDRLFLPLQRLDADRGSNPEGLGLGLSIVDAIARAHDATIAVVARPAGGLDVEVRFPRHDGAVVAERRAGLDPTQADDSPGAPVPAGLV
jgi:signal transduction histidine kinase